MKPKYSLSTMARLHKERLLLGTILLAFALVFPMPTTAGADAGVGILLPPPIIFPAPPMVVVIPETYVYVVPDSDMDIFFYHGWWWRPWEGRWYRSRHYDSGWGHYQRVPSFYGRIPPSWRNDYREHRWRGHPWNSQRVPHEQLQGNWSAWEKNRHWEKQQTWGVQGLKPRSRAQSGEVRQKHSQPQHQKATPQSKSRKGKPERGDNEKQGGKGHGR